MTIEIFPLEKVVIDGAAIYLGQKQSCVESAIGKGQRIGARYYYFNNDMAIDYSDGKVEYIEFLSGVDGSLHPIVYGVSAFDAKADELYHILDIQNDGPVCDAESGYCYQFQRISVGVYRESVPEEIEAMIEEAAHNGNPMSDDEIAYERKRANHWATIGIGSAGYYQR